MKTGYLTPLVASLVIVALCIANWDLLSQTVSLNLLFGQLQAPLLVLLILCIGIVLFSSLAAAMLSTHAWKTERRRLVSDLDKARGLAEREEESRTQALRTIVEREFVAVREKLDRILASQGAGVLGREPSREPEKFSDTSQAIEPELIPPRTPSPRRRH